MQTAYLSIPAGKLFIKYCKNHAWAATNHCMHVTFVSYTIFILRLILLILLCLWGIGGFAQTFSGKVTEATTGQPLYPVTVVNIRTQQATYTTEGGNFNIAAQQGDKIAFSYVGYKTLEYPVTENDAGKTTTIRMVRVSYQLKELVLMPDFTQYQIDSIERVKTYRPFLTRTKSSAFSSPVSFVAEKFNKRSKQIFRFQKKFGQWEDERFIDSRYTPELANEMTGLDGDSLAHFMNAYPMPYDYARAATELEMKMWIRDHYRQWLKMIDTTGIPVINDTLLQKF